MDIYFLMDRLLGTEWLDDIVVVCLTFKTASKLFSEVVGPFTFPSAVHGSYSFLYIFFVVVVFSPRLKICPVMFGGVDINVREEHPQVASRMHPDQGSSL